MTTKSETGSRRPFDLHAAYSTINADEDLSERPILRQLDFKTVTAFNLKFARIPGMFTPRTSHHKTSQESPKKRGGRGGGGGGRGRGRGRGRGGGRHGR